LQEGNCYLGKDCGLDQYFHFGACLPALENCMNFKQIGGECLECVNGYTFAYTQNGKICIPIPNSLMQTETPQTITTSGTSGSQSNSNRSQTAPTTANTTTSIQTTSNSSNNSKSTANHSNADSSSTPTTPPPKRSPTISCEQGTY